DHLGNAENGGARPHDGGQPLPLGLLVGAGTVRVIHAFLRRLRGLFDGVPARQDQRCPGEVRLRVTEPGQEEVLLLFGVGWRLFLRPGGRGHLLYGLLGRALSRGARGEPRWSGYGLSGYQFLVGPHSSLLSLARATRPVHPYRVPSRSIPFHRRSTPSGAATYRPTGRFGVVGRLPREG